VDFYGEGQIKVRIIDYKCIVLFRSFQRALQLMNYFRGVNLVGNLGGGGRGHAACFRVQTSYSQNWPYVETSDTVEDKNKNVYIITGQLKLSIYAPYFFLGGGMTYYRPPVRHFGGDVSPCPPRDLRP